MPIDRKSLVRRHCITRTATDPIAPLQLGNGEIGLSIDATGLQTFPQLHVSPGRDPQNPGSLLGTQSQWGWHTIPREPEPQLETAKRSFATPRGDVRYVDIRGKTSATGPETATEEEKWLRANPHRLMLGWIGLAPSRVMGSHGGGTSLDPESLEPIRQHLDLWTGIATSEFRLHGTHFTVRTAVHPSEDTVGWSITSDGPESPAVELRFPYGSGAWGNAADWASDSHHTEVELTGATAVIRRELDGTRYFVKAHSGGELAVDHSSNHQVTLTSVENDRDSWDLALNFAPEAPHGAADSPTTSAQDVFAESARWWEEFWLSGGAIDFTGSTDPRAAELERRIVLSQYLTAINCSGSLPPQETGLMVNSWRGKFHLEMHWWHAAHFPLWGRSPLLERSMDWYRRILPLARGTAAEQGVSGARWPKQVGPEGHETPSDIGPFLLWQQPHPISFAELLRRSGSPEALERYADLVFETAEFMASHPVETGGAAHLEGPLIPAQECYADVKEVLSDPTFELAYWHWGLSVAIQWREMLDLERKPHWEHIRDALPAPHQRDGVYTAVRHPELDRRRDHPSVLAALGVVPETPLVDARTMEATLTDILEHWDWESTWGWDYPMMAMAATRVGRPDLAVDCLLKETSKNTHLTNGHNWQNEGLPLYLPGNGGLLIAAALMAAGWDGSSDTPGFPEGFTVHHEGLSRLPR